MKVLVGVKQVPGPGEVRYVPGVNRIDRADAGNRMNPHDRAALGCALLLRGARGGEVVAFTMGPEQAREVLEEALSCGADRAVHMSDMRFAGADTLATSRALAQLCRTERPDLVLFGRIALDGGTSQVAPQVAEMLGWPSVTEATGVQIEGGGVEVSRRRGTGLERWHVDLPAVVSVDLLEASAASASNLSPPGRGGVTELDVDALGGDEAGYGIRGSATFVQRIDPLGRRGAGQVVTDPAAAAKVLVDAARPSPPVARPTSDAPAGELWVVAVAGGRAERPAEGIAALARVAGVLGAEIVAAVLGRAEPDALQRLASAGADRVIEARSHALDTGETSAEAEVDALAALIEERSPIAVVGPWTPRGRSLMARVAARLAIGLTGDVVGLDVSPRPGSSGVVDLVWLKPAWNGAALARVVARSAIAMGTLRPSSVAPLAPRPTSGVSVETVDVKPAGDGRRTALLVERADTSAVPIEEADVVVCIGGACRELARAALRGAEKLGWVVAGTPGAVAAGLVPPEAGLVPERYSLSPRLAVGVGIERAEDLAPLRGAVTIVTVDPDRDAPAHSVADVAVVCDPDALIASLTL